MLVCMGGGGDVLVSGFWSVKVTITSQLLHAFKSIQTCLWWKQTRFPNVKLLPYDLMVHKSASNDFMLHQTSARG